MSHSSRFFATFLPVSSLVLLASTAHAATLDGPLDKALWATNVPGHIDMFIAVPDNLPANPPILVNIHSCGNSAGGQWSYDGFAPIRDAMETVGFIMIVPQQSRNCWDVGTSAALTNGGGSDTGAIVQMVQYTIDTYNADPTRVYAMGGSGGGMMVQALMAVYPEVFKGGHARAGVPAGCWAESYDDGQQWSGPCAGGSVSKTGQEWGDLVRAMNPSFTGPRPRIQINQGNVDETISFNNFGEAIKEWTNVLGLAEAPTSTDSNFAGAEATYDRQFWTDECGYTVIEMWEALGMGHSMGYESVHILEFFGLDQVRDQDPWDEQCGDFGGSTTGGAGGASSTTMGTATTGDGGSTVTTSGMGGMTAATTTGADTTTTDAGSTATGVGGTTAVAATADSGTVTTGAGVSTTGGAVASGVGGSAATTTTGGPDDGSDMSLPPPTPEGGCGCRLGAASSRKGGAASLALVLLGLVLRRRRNAAC